MPLPSSQRRLSSQKFTSQSTQTRYFKEVLTNAGVVLQQEDEPNIFKKEQSLIIRDIKKELETHFSYPNNVNEFMNGLKCLVKKPAWLKKALLPSQLQQVNEHDIVIRIQQENVFRVLLSIDCLQSEIISLILDEVTTHAVEEAEDQIWLRLLLGPLRYLSYIKDAKQLSTRLLEILEVATYPAQLEILVFIPDIIPDSEYDETAKQLSKILNQTTELTCAIIDCLNYLNLSADTKEDIQDQIWTILNLTSSLKTFTLIFCFLVTDVKSANLPNILLKTRNALDSIILTQTSNNDTDSDQALTFDEIRSVIINSKAVSEGWINLINNIRSSNDHKSVDVIILLLLHSAGSNRKHFIEGIFKKKIKNRQLKPTLLESTLQKYIVPQILNSCLEIGSFLLRMHTEPQFLEFARIFYTTAFAHKHADIQHRQQILNSLIMLTGSGDAKGPIPALEILGHIAEKNLELLQPHTMRLMNLLDKLEETDLSEVKQMFDLLCCLTCGPRADESVSMFKNDIHMIVSKQLSSSKKNIKYRGIIAAVATAKNIASFADDEDSSELGDDSYNSISDLPTGPGKQAAGFLELAYNSTSGCPVALGLYYDQLAQMVVTTENLDKYFLSWLFDTITNNFQEVYITDKVSEAMNDIQITLQYNLNSNEEIETLIAVNIAELTIKSDKNDNAMLVFAPLFRLLRLIHHRKHDGNLSSIDALLGCGILLPEIDPDVGIDSFETDQAKQVVDCVFHCINWFREIISAFVTQKSKKLRQKILDRLKYLLELEDLFLNCMKSMPEHKLPMSYFYNINLDSSTGSVQLEKSKILGKRKRNDNVNNTTRVTQTTQAQTTSKPGRKPQNKEKEVSEFQFREMDTDIILLLKYPLIIDETERESQSLALTLPQFKFIIKDLVMKLHKVTKTSQQTVFSHLVTVKAEDLITDCVRLMPHINKHLITVIDETKQLLEKCDGIHDAHEMFLQAATELKICFSLILEMLSLILGWSGFQNKKNLPLFRDCLRALVDEKSSQLHSAQGLIAEFLKCIMALVDYCLSLPCAVHLVNIVKALCNVTTDETPKKKLVLLSGKLLSTRWFSLTGLQETGAVANLHIDNLVRAHLAGSNVETISSVVSWIHAECSELQSKDDHLTTFPAINKANFPILYRGVCATLLEALRSELHGLTNTEHLTVWHNTVSTMRSLMDIVKMQESRANLAAFLKKSIAILKVFLSQGLPMLELMLRSHSDKVIEILRTLQQTTRFIHNLCCHSKVTKDSALIAHVPQMRLTLETLVYRVKAALMANDCSAAFWMGNLKNKNLHGEEILSQSTNMSGSETNEQVEEQSDDELPADDSEDELALSTSNTTSGNDDISDVV